MRKVLCHSAVTYIAIADTDHLADVFLVNSCPKLLRLHHRFFSNDAEKGRSAKFFFTTGEKLLHVVVVEAQVLHRNALVLQLLQRLDADFQVRERVIFRHLSI